jgi:hypothetical protein
MSTNVNPTTRIRRPLTVCYIGRPVSLYIDALAKRQRTQTVPEPSPDGAAGQPPAS